MRERIWRMVLIFMLLGIAGCGGGESQVGGGGAPRAMMTAVNMPTSPSQSVGGLQLTLNIPNGVTARVNPATGQVASDVVQLVGATDQTKVYSAVDYTPATAVASGKLKFMVIDTLGFISGEYLTIRLDVVQGFFPVATDFSISDYVISDLNGVTINGLTPTFTVDII